MRYTNVRPFSHCTERIELFLGIKLGLPSARVITMLEMGVSRPQGGYFPLTILQILDFTVSCI